MSPQAFPMSMKNAEQGQAMSEVYSFSLIACGPSINCVDYCDILSYHG